MEYKDLIIQKQKKTKMSHMLISFIQKAVGRSYWQTSMTTISIFLFKQNYSLRQIQNIIIQLHTFTYFVAKSE